MNELVDSLVDDMKQIFGSEFGHVEVEPAETPLAESVEPDWVTLLSEAAFRDPRKFKDNLKQLSQQHKMMRSKQRDMSRERDKEKEREKEQRMADPLYQLQREVEKKEQERKRAARAEKPEAPPTRAAAPDTQKTVRDMLHQIRGHVPHGRPEWGDQERPGHQSHGAEGGTGGPRGHNPFKRKSTLGKGPLGRYHKKRQCWHCSCGNIYNAGCKCVGTGATENCPKGQIKKVKIDRAYRDWYNGVYHSWAAKKAQRQPAVAAGRHASVGR